MPGETADHTIAHRSAGTAIVARHDCGLVHRMRRLPDGGSAQCPRCGATLYQHRADSIERALMLTLTALILFVVAMSRHFVTPRNPRHEIIVGWDAPLDTYSFRYSTRPSRTPRSRRLSPWPHKRSSASCAPQPTAGSFMCRKR